MKHRTAVPKAQPPLRTCMLGLAIREARLAADLTQEDLGQRLSTPQSVVSEWEHGWAGIRLETVHEVEKALNLANGALLRAAGYVADSSATGKPS